MKSADIDAIVLQMEQRMKDGLVPLAWFVKANRDGMYFLKSPDLQWAQ